jgi:hypothetical protein
MLALMLLLGTCARGDLTNYHIVFSDGPGSLKTFPSGETNDIGAAFLPGPWGGGTVPTNVVVTNPSPAIQAIETGQSEYIRMAQSNDQSLLDTRIVDVYLTQTNTGTKTAWWNMIGTDTNTTQVLDSGPSAAYHASNMPSVATGPTLFVTNSQNYYLIDGTGTYFWVNDAAALTPTAMTITAWVNLHAYRTGVIQTIAAKFGNAGAYEYTFCVYPADDSVVANRNRLTLGLLTLNASKYHYRFSSQMLPTQEIVFVAFTWAGNGTNTILYTNGMACSMTASGAGGFTVLSDGAAPLTIGKSSNSSPQPWDGLISDVRYFNVALTASQIANIYTQGVHSSVGSLTNIWTDPLIKRTAAGIDGAGAKPTCQVGSSNDSSIVFPAPVNFSGLRGSGLAAGVVSNDSCNVGQMQAYGNNFVSNVLSGCKVYPANGQSFTNDVYTKVRFNSEVYDYGGEWDTTNFRFAAAKSGRYIMFWRLFMVGFSAHGLEINPCVYTNGSLAINGTQASISGTNIIDCAGEVYLNSGEYLEAWVRQRDSATRTNITSVGCFLTVSPVK